VTPESPALIDAVRALARAARVVQPAVGELSPADYRLMSAIVSGEDRASRLAARLALGKPTISANVETLCQRGLLVRGTAADDQRAAVLRLTDDGRELLAKVETAMTDWLDGLRARTPGGEQLIDSLVWLGTAIDDLLVERSAARRGSGR
jgi:DNA-binding MarR family transcriptional regulator